MNKLIRIFAGTLLVTLFGLQSSFALTLDEIGSKLQRENSHSVHYTQDKYLKDANLNLKSAGTIVSVKNKGILIRQTEPYQMELAVKKDSITEYSAGVVHTIKAEDNPAVHSLLNLILKLMNPDESLTEDFDCKLNGSKEKFNLTLSPKDKTLKNFFGEISLNGTENIDSLVINGTHGDTTSMQFSAYDFSNKAVTSEDLKYFE